MNVEGLSGLVNRVIAWAHGMQRRHGVLGFPYAVVKKYGDDEGGRQAALITYYGFLSIFPLLLLGVAVLSRVLADHQDLRRRLTDAIVPPALQPTIEHSLATLPSSTIPFVAGLIGLLLSGTGVVFSAYQTLNYVAAVRHRRRAGFVSRYLRVFAMLAALMLGALAVGALTVVATALPGQPGVQRAAAVAGSALVAFAVLLLGAKVLLARPAPVRALWPGALAGCARRSVSGARALPSGRGLGLPNGGQLGGGQGEVVAAQATAGIDAVVAASAPLSTPPHQRVRAHFTPGPSVFEMRTFVALSASSEVVMARAASAMRNVWETISANGIASAWRVSRAIVPSYADLSTAITRPAPISAALT